MSKVFISYRRSDGAIPANLVRNVLLKDFNDEDIFMDTVSMPRGKYPELIQERLQEVDFFILIVTENSFRSKSNAEKDEDVYYTEIEKALDNGIKIIPLIFNCELTPDDLPECLRSRGLEYHNQIKYNHEYPGAFERRLREYTKKEVNGIWGGILACCGLVGVIVAIWLFMAGLGFLYQWYADRELDASEQYELMVANLRGVSGVDGVFIYDLGTEIAVYDNKSKQVQFQSDQKLNSIFPGLRKENLSDIGFMASSSAFLVNVGKKAMSGSRSNSKTFLARVGFVVALVAGAGAGCVVYRVINPAEHSESMRKYVSEPSNWKTALEKMPIVRGIPICI